jgi:starch-binding outer membrane protein, SusD/RagB family
MRIQARLQPRHSAASAHPPFPGIRIFLLVPLLCGTAACDSLLEVDLPGRVQGSDLNDPTFANTLVLSAQGDFECALNSYVWSMGLWTTDIHPANITRTNQLVAQRNEAVRQLSGLGSAGNQPTCRQTNPPPLYLPLQTARVQASNAINIIGQFDEASVPAKRFLIGKAHAYRGYAIQLLSEAFCEVTFDAGPIETREQGFQRAVDDFTAALDLLTNVTSGGNAEEAAQLVNMALIGRARARLNLGDAPGVLADAAAVSEGFVRYVDRTPTSTQTRNTIYDETRDNSIAVAEAYHNLEVDGVPDPRVQVSHVGFGIGADGLTDVWAQLKYMTLGDDIPFATWREAQLMIAEVEGGQTAVDIINLLRSTHDLPSFSSDDPAAIRAQVLEERRRELWLQGTRLGDMLRNDIPFVTGLTPKLEPYGPLTCIPLPDREELANDNF